MNIKKTWKILFEIFATLMCIFLAGYDVAMANGALINNALNVKTYKVVEAEGGENIDSEYFKAEYSNASEFAKASAELCREVESEGLVLLTNENDALPLPQNAKIVGIAYTTTRSGFVPSSPVFV